MEPKTAIALSTYNNMDCITKCIENILNQNYKNLKIFVTDDGSTDETAVIIEEFGRKDSRLQLTRLPHGERGIARTTSIRKAFDWGCEFLYFIDSDMILEKGLISDCIRYFSENPKVGALVIPEIPFSESSNFYSKVKVFERTILNDAGENLGKNSIEAARFWRGSEYKESGGINPKQISFEETQPTIRYLKGGGIIKRACFAGVRHDERHVCLRALLSKKKYYFSVMDKTIENEENGLWNALSRWYFFRPVLYRKSNLSRMFRHPLLSFGMWFMYVCLTLTAVQVMFSKTMRFKSFQ